jgi:pseudouridine synthase
MEERLQKLLSRWGVASRRHAEELIKAGRVRVNGDVAELGRKADPDRDRIVLDGRELSAQNRPQMHYLLLNKPLAVVSTCQDPQGRNTVLAFVPKAIRQGAGIHPVGRLDYNSTGALLLTNDGGLTHQLTHPRHQMPKIYRVVVAGKPSSDAIAQWRQGVMLGDRRTFPAEVTVISESDPDSTELEIVLKEGRNRQIRRVADSLGHPVKRLHRVAIGPIHLADLAPGAIRPLTAAELDKLRQGINATMIESSDRD